MENLDSAYKRRINIQIIKAFREVYCSNGLGSLGSSVVDQVFCCDGFLYNKNRDKRVSKAVQGGCVSELGAALNNVKLDELGGKITVRDALAGGSSAD